MNAENEFEKWWAEYAPEFGFPCTGDGLKQWCLDGFVAAYALGKQSGIDSVNSLPHRAMFDAGVAFGRKSGLEDAAEIAMQKDCPHDLGCGQSVAAAIRQRIEETP